MKEEIKMENQTLMQYFEWYLPADGNHWTRLAEDAQHLADLGIRKVWMPPAFKATSNNDVGYGVYDLFDLGEFDQKGTVRTKYGFKDDYLQAIQALKDAGIQPMADVVLNHKAAADGLEEFEVVEVDPMDRNKVLTEPFTIQGWTKFTLMVEMEPIMTSTGIGTISPVLTTMLHVIRMESTKSKGTTKVGLMEIW